MADSAYCQFGISDRKLEEISLPEVIREEDMTSLFNTFFPEPSETHTQKLIKRLPKALSQFLFSFFGNKNYYENDLFLGTRKSWLIAVLEDYINLSGYDNLKFLYGGGKTAKVKVTDSNWTINLCVLTPLEVANVIDELNQMINGIRINPEALVKIIDDGYTSSDILTLLEESKAYNCQDEAHELSEDGDFPEFMFATLKSILALLKKAENSKTNFIYTIVEP